MGIDCFSRFTPQLMTEVVDFERVLESKVDSKICLRFQRYGLLRASPRNDGGSRFSICLRIQNLYHFGWVKGLGVHSKNLESSLFRFKRKFRNPLPQILKPFQNLPLNHELVAFRIYPLRHFEPCVARRGNPQKKQIAQQTPSQNLNS